MRVLHVTDCYLPRLGGIETHVADLVDRQRRVGHDARVVTMTPAAAGVPDPEWVRRTGGRAGDQSRSPLRADAALRDLLVAWAPDVVHVHVSVVSPFASLAARRTTAAGIPTLLTVHSMWSSYGPVPAIAGVLLQLRRWPLQWSAVSTAAAAPLRRLLGPQVDVAVLPNAVDPADWRLPTGVHSGSTGPTLVSVMRFTRTKRALPLARMLREVRDTVPAGVELRAVVAGDGPQRPAFERYLRRHDMTDWVELPGRIDRSEVHRVLAGGDCFVAPAQLESFGIAALEARAAGLPVIGSARSGVGEFVRHGREGLLAADDDEMVAAMVRMVTDDGLRAALRAHNERTPIAHDWSAACVQTDRLYDRAAAVAALGAGVPDLVG